MKSQNPTRNDPKPATIPPADAPPKAEKPDRPLEAERELTDDEIAAIAGGITSGRRFPTP
jgi:hypothetical protein